jgi:hypothetical protein
VEARYVEQRIADAPLFINGLLQFLGSLVCAAPRSVPEPVLFAAAFGAIRERVCACLSMRSAVQLI